MPAGYGFAGHIGFALESSGNTAVAATDYVEAISEDLTAQIDRYEPINIHGKFSEPDDQAGLRRIGGSIVIPAHAEAIGKLLAGGLGLQSNTVVLSGFLHKHEFAFRTAAQDDWDTKYPERPMTFEIFRDVTSSQQYAGCNITQIQIGTAPNQELRFTAGLVGTSVNDGIAKTTPTYTTSPTAPFTFDTASVSIAAAASAIVEGFNFTMNSQLQGIPVLNASTNIAKIRRSGPQIARLSGTLSFESITEYEAFKNQTEQAFSINVTKADSFQMLIEIPRLVYSAFPLGMPGRDRQTISFDGMCRYHTGSANAAKLSLWNTTSGY